MRIVTIRRIVQIFFFVLFLWFSVVMNLGERWWQLRGWPVNWMLQLDPLVGLATLLTTRTLYSGLLWGLATVVLTIFLGRFFCGWVCPFGTLHQITGYLGHRKKSPPAMAVINRYRRGQSVKYGILILLLAAAVGDIFAGTVRLSGNDPLSFWIIVMAGLTAVALLAGRKLLPDLKKSLALFLLLAAVWGLSGMVFRPRAITAASLQTGLLDPIPLFHRTVNLVLLPMIDGSVGVLSSHPRHYTDAGLIGILFVIAVLLNLYIPRFYCRFVCPLGALFGVLGRYALWRVGKKRSECTDCRLCETHCEGGCDPSTRIRIAECVLCMNCLDECRHDLMGYHTVPSATGERSSPDVSRRGFVISLFSGLAVIPTLRLNSRQGANWHPGLVRPPGALSEEDFLHRCVKCGQCMRICPTNVIQPADFSMGLEALWTPVLNFRIGSSGCQLNCIACGHLCPTAAIRPLSLDEKLGKGTYADRGPVKIGAAFVDRGRCLPWAMDTPCIVCQENCPVSPKAITTREHFSVIQPLPDALTVAWADAFNLEFEQKSLAPDRYGTGDFHVRIRGEAGGPLRPVLTNTEQRVTLSEVHPFDPVPLPGSRVDFLIRLQRPFVNPGRCIGCGICQHECPVKGKRAIRVTADNETRNGNHAMVL